MAAQWHATFDDGTHLYFASADAKSMRAADLRASVTKAGAKARTKLKADLAKAQARLPAALRKPVKVPRLTSCRCVG